MPDAFALFAWPPSLALGNPLIDSEHAGLFAAAQRLHEAMLAASGRQALARLVDELLRYVAEHFAHEERFMAEVGYPLLAEHAREHHALRRRVLHLREGFAAGEDTITVQTMQFLSEWLRRHIGSADLRIAQHCSARQRGAPPQGGGHRAAALAGGGL